MQFLCKFNVNEMSVSYGPVMKVEWTVELARRRKGKNKSRFMLQITGISIHHEISEIQFDDHISLLEKKSRICAPFHDTPYLVKNFVVF